MINVFLGEVVPTDIAVHQGYIVGFGAYPAHGTMDLKGNYAAPGFIDAHVHIESAMVTPAEFARAVLPHGTTAVVADPHEIANVLGAEGIRFMLRRQPAPAAPFFLYPALLCTGEPAGEFGRGAFGSGSGAFHEKVIRWWDWLK